MLHIPHDMADLLVTTSGHAPHHMLLPREVFARLVDR